MAKRKRDGSYRSDGARPGKQMRPDTFPEGGLLGPRETKHPADEHWIMPGTVAWHYTVELENFARQINDPQLTEAINAIIEKLKPEELAHTPEEIFQQVQDAIVSTTKSRTTNRNVGLLLGAVGVASSVYNQYLAHIAQIKADASYLCQFAGLLCQETPTFTQWALASMPRFKETSEIAMSLLAIALFSMRLQAKYKTVKSVVLNAIELTKTIFGYSLVKKEVKVAPAAAEPGAAEPGAAAAAAAAEDHSTQEGLQGIDMGDIKEINKLLDNLKESLADPALEDGMLGGRRRRRQRTRRRKTRRCKAKRNTKKRSCCSKRRRKTRHRHSKQRRRHRQTRR